MQGLQLSMLLAAALATTALADEHRYGDTLPTHLVETPGREWVRQAEPIDVLAEALTSSEPIRIHYPGSDFIRVHFSRFSLPAGVVVEVSDSSGSETYRYEAGGMGPMTFDRRRGDDGRNRFFAMSVTGDDAFVRVDGSLDRIDLQRHGVVIDGWQYGSRRSDASPAKKEEPDWQVESTCGASQRYDARCYQQSHPDEYGRSMAVAKLITSSGEECTAWRVGADNRMFTAEHCISSQDDVDGSEIWFDYRAESCGGSTASAPVKVAGAELLALDGTLDYALFTVDEFSRISDFGYLGLDIRDGVEGQGIFIPQHGLGRPMQIALQSDMNVSGWCEIDEADLDGYGSDTDIGYFCDTTTSSSGSPVLARDSGSVIALHHLGGCFNSGSKMSLIWAQVSSYFGGVVPAGSHDSSQGAGNLAPNADFTFACNQNNCSYDASPSEAASGQIQHYQWDFGDGNTDTGHLVTHAYASSGDYTVNLTVWDQDDRTDSLSRNVTVSVPNIRPEARFSSQCLYLQCEFDGAGSSDADGQVVSWNWQFGDGTQASGSKVTHQYPAAGGYTVTLIVSDGLESSSRSHSIAVNSASETIEPCATDPDVIFSSHFEADDCS